MMGTIKSKYQYKAWKIRFLFYKTIFAIERKIVAPRPTSIKNDLIPFKFFKIIVENEKYDCQWKFFLRESRLNFEPFS